MKDHEENLQNEYIHRINDPWASEWLSECLQPIFRFATSRKRLTASAVVPIEARGPGPLVQTPVGIIQCKFGNARSVGEL